MGKQPSKIHKWLNGDHNFTLRSIARLQAELGEVLLEVPTLKATANYITTPVRKFSVFVNKKPVVDTRQQSWLYELELSETKPLANAG